MAGFVIIGNAGNQRVTRFQQALQGLNQPPARLVTYADLLAGRVALAEVIQAGDSVRIESPGEDFEVERAILALGADQLDPEATREGGEYLRCERAEAENLAFDQGMIVFSRQWYLGFQALLQKIKTDLALCPSHHLMNDPAEITVMFDKLATQARLSEGGVKVPLQLGIVRSYSQLIERMQQMGLRRVFIKLAHGSSASGVIAFQTNGRQFQATTTVEMADSALYNSKQIKVYRSETEIARLIDLLAGHRVIAEQWIPKASFEGRVFDLRVMVIGGETRHVVVRLSQHTLTNLHLANQRTDLEHLLTRLPTTSWEEARATCEQVATLFPASFYAGIDLLIASDYRHHAVAEVNAFGDLLYRTLDRGQDTYTAEITAFQDRLNSA